MSINKVILIGNLGQDPEVRYTPGGLAIANLSIATTESWNDKNTGQKQEKTEWHRVVVMGKLAELCKQYLSKGRQVYVEGGLQTRQWQDKEGQTRYTTEVRAQSVQFLGGQKGAQTQSDTSGSGYSSGSRSFGAGNAGGVSTNAPTFGSNVSEPDFNEEDVPF